MTRLSLLARSGGLLCLMTAGVLCVSCERTIGQPSIAALGKAAKPSVSTRLPAPATVAALCVDQTLRLQYTASGCFHHEERDIDIRRTAGGGFIARVDDRIPAYGNKSVTVEVPLTAADAAAIDKELAEHRHPPEGACTSAVFIDVILSDPTGELSRERIQDDSCEVGGPLHSLGTSPSLEKLKRAKPGPR
jgi:hypothetical protein